MLQTHRAEGGVPCHAGERVHEEVVRVVREASRQIYKLKFGQNYNENSDTPCDSDTVTRRGCVPVGQKEGKSSKNHAR